MSSSIFQAVSCLHAADASCLQHFLINWDPDKSSFSVMLVTCSLWSASTSVSSFHLANTSDAFKVWLRYHHFFPPTLKLLNLEVCSKGGRSILNSKNTYGSSKFVIILWILNNIKTIGMVISKIVKSFSLLRTLNYPLSKISFKIWGLVSRPGCSGAASSTVLEDGFWWWKGTCDFGDKIRALRCKPGTLSLWIIEKYKFWEDKSFVWVINNNY